MHDPLLLDHRPTEYDFRMAAVVEAASGENEAGSLILVPFIMLAAFSVLLLAGFNVTVHHDEPVHKFRVKIDNSVSAPETLTAPDVSQYAVEVNADMARGSGVNTKYCVLTCHHVIVGRKSIEVTCGGETAKATVIEVDTKNDVAVLKVQWKQPHPEAELSTDVVSIGDKLSSAGRSKDGTITVDDHVCQANARNEITMTNASNSGRSGAGLFDCCGKLVGLVRGNVTTTVPYLAWAVGIVPIKVLAERCSPTPVSLGREDYTRYNPCYENGGSTSKSHLVRDHGINPATLNGLSQREIDGLHGKAHGERPRQVAKPVQQSYPVFKSGAGCPNGRCPLQRN